MADKGKKTIKCASVTRTGAPCRGWATLDSTMCNMHRDYGGQEILTPVGGSEPAEKPKGKPGRPPTPDEVFERYLIALRAGKTYAEAAKLAGTSYDVTLKRRNIDPNFDAAVRLAWDEGTSRYEEKINEVAISGHYNALLAVLKSRDSARWSEKQTLTVEQTPEIDRTDHIATIVGMLKKLEQRALLRGDVIDIPAIEQGEYVPAEVPQWPSEGSKRQYRTPH